MNEQTAVPTFWCTGFLANGVKVSYTVPTAATGAAAYQHALEFTSALLAAGFRTNEPGAAEGEAKDVIGWVCRHVKVDDVGEETPVVDLYADHEKMTHKVLRVYLNTPEDVAAFEAASGFKLDKLPLVETPAPIERGSSPLTDKKIIRAAQPFAVYHVANKNYVEGGKKAKRHFAHWDVTTPAPTPPPAEAPATPKAANVTQLEADTSGTRELIAAIVETKEYTDKKSGELKKRLVYHCADGVFATAFSTRTARDSGYDVTAWGEVGEHDIMPPAVVTVKQKGDFWDAVAVRPSVALGATGTDDIDFLS